MKLATHLAEVSLYMTVKNSKRMLSV